MLPENGVPSLGRGAGVVITTASDLSTRLNVERETLAIASQQAGSEVIDALCKIR